MVRVRKIAITGLSKAGKSVFLVSLLQHLRYHNHQHFPLTPTARPVTTLCKFSPVKAGNAHFKPFPYSQLLGELTAQEGGVLPGATRDASVFKFHLTRKRAADAGAKLDFLRQLLTPQDYLFEFVDFPGERLLDVDMFKNPTFSAWSDDVWGCFTSHAHIYSHLGRYCAELEAVQASPTDAQAVDTATAAKKILETYKRSLTGMITNGVQYITPSSFWRDFETGTAFSSSDAEKGGIDRICGLKVKEFAPLPKDVRSARPDLERLFSGHYETYRREVIMPLFMTLKRCDRLLFLVDIPDILNSGVTKFNEIVRLLEIFGRAMDRTSWFRRGVKKVLFIATKSDMVSLQDQSNLETLTRDLMNYMSNAMSKADFEPHVVSAWVSTTAVTGKPYKLNAKILAQPAPDCAGPVTVHCVLCKDLRDMEYSVSKVPDHWPESDWERGTFLFADQALYPLTRQTVPPRHRNMNKVFLSLL